MSEVGPRARVLIVDDSALVRRTLTKLCEEDASIEVVGTASNGRLALAMVEKLVPDVMVLDVEMPEMSGLEVLRVVSRDYPSVAVVMFSAHTERGAAVTMDALMAGAADYVAKPSGRRNYAEAQDAMRAELLPKLKALVSDHLFTRPPPQLGRSAAPSMRATLPRRVVATPLPPRHDAAHDPGRPGRPIELVAIGSSTGGPEALAVALTDMGPLDVPLVITQHMPPKFTRALADRLSARTGLRVQEAAGGELLLPGEVWVAPGDHHLLVVAGDGGMRIQLDDGAKENSCRPAVDPMLRSVAVSYGATALTVILTGMGRDGLAGCHAMRAVGGRVFVQDRATSVVWGMPGYVHEAGLAEKTLPIEAMGAAVRQATREGRRLPKSASEMHHVSRT